MNSFSSSKKNIIVGAGFSGLSLAYFLAKRGALVEIYESSDRLGGMIDTSSTHYGLSEFAANGIVKSPLVTEFLKELGVELAVNLPSQKKKFIWRGRLRRWPLSFLETLSFIRSSVRLFAIYILQRDRIIPRPNQKLGDWAGPLFPYSVKKYLLETGLLGIYGAHTSELSSELILKSLIDPNEPKRDSYKGMISPQSGMVEIIKKLEEKLRSFSCVKIHLNSTFVCPENFDLNNNNLIICTSAPAAAVVSKEIDPISSQWISQIQMHAKSTVTIFYEHFPKSSVKGFGCLIPENDFISGQSNSNLQEADSEKYPAPLGILQNSYIFSGRDKTYCENWIFSDVGQNFLLRQNEESLKQYLTSMRKVIFDERIEIQHIFAKHWNPALPKYDLALEQVLRNLKPRKGVYFHGNYMGQIGLTGLLQRSLNLSRSLDSKSKALVLLNIGTPESQHPWSVAKYLSSFLMDPDVIQLAWPWRFLLVYGIILPFRSFKSAAKYAKIWTTDGSPLLVLSNKLKSLLDLNLTQSKYLVSKASPNNKQRVFIGMRYGKPSIAPLEKELKEFDEITVLPLFPQYAEATTGSILKKIKSTWSYDTVSRTQFVLSFFDHPTFIQACADRIRSSLGSKFNEVHLLFSFHGLPESHIRSIPGCEINSLCCKTPRPKCYRSQCIATANGIADALNLKSNRWTISFQSRFGRDKWIGPSTDETLKDLGIKNKKVAVFCPAFVSDCLETLEEIAIEGKAIFNASGGTEYYFVPCLNDHPLWVQALEQISGIDRS